MAFFQRSALGVFRRNARGTRNAPLAPGNPFAGESSFTISLVGELQVYESSSVLTHPAVYNPTHLVATYPFSEVVFPTQGLNFALRTLFNPSTRLGAQWGYIDASGFTGLSEDDEYNDHTGWSYNSATAFDAPQVMSASRSGSTLTVELRATAKSYNNGTDYGDIRGIAAHLGTLLYPLWLVQWGSDVDTQAPNPGTKGLRWEATLTAVVA